MICTKVVAVGLGKSFSVYIGQGDFENDCTRKDISDDEYLQGAVQDFVDWGSWLVPEALSEDSSVFI